MLQTDTERMTVEHYTELIDLLHDKISRLEHEKDEQRKEINRLKRQIKTLEEAAYTTTLPEPER